MIDARPASRMAAANGSAYTSRSSRGPRCTGAWFMPPSDSAVAEEVLAGGDHAVARASAWMPRT